MSRESLMLTQGPFTMTFPRDATFFGLVRRGPSRWASLGLLAATSVASLTTSRNASAVEAAIGAPVAYDAFDRNRDAPPNESPTYYSDGVYGRFDGELSLVPSLGMQHAAAGWFTQVGVAGFYLSTVGVIFRTSEGRWSPVSPRADFNVSSLALALRPLFLLRWTQDWEKGPSFLDLTIDSLTLSVGSYWAQQHSLELQRYGLETELSFGFPLLGKAHGPWLTASVVNRVPKVTHAGSRFDFAYGFRFEWSFSLGN